MTVAELFDSIEVQGEVKIVYVEPDGYDRIQVEYEDAMDCDIEYIYCEKCVIYIEVYAEDLTKVSLKDMPYQYPRCEFGKEEDECEYDCGNCPYEDLDNN